MQGLEVQSSSPSLFEGLKVSVASRIEKVNSVATKEGKAIRRQFGDQLAFIKEGVIPDKLDVADITLPPGNFANTAQDLVQYRREGNELFMVTRQIGRIEDFSMNPFDREPPRYVHFSKDEQSERVLRPLTPAEWIKYAPTLVVKLIEAVQKAQSAKPE